MLLCCEISVIDFPDDVRRGILILEAGGWRLERADRESLNIVILQSSTLEMAYSIAFRKAIAMAKYIEHLLESFHRIEVSSHVMAIPTHPSARGICKYVGLWRGEWTVIFEYVSVNVRAG